MFNVIAAIFVMLVSWTLIREYRRTGRITLLSILTLGNISYGVVTPVIAYYSPDSAVIFRKYVFAAGVSVDESGLIRVILAATIFQLACLCVSIAGKPDREEITPNPLSDGVLIKQAIRIGWGLMLVGAVGVVWLGMIYNGHLLGLYEISYSDRSGLSRQNSVAAFMLLLGVLGASQLIVVFLLADRVKTAIFILLLVALHGLGMKSKFPVFSVLFIFLVVAIGRRRNVIRLLAPVILTGIVLMTMSILRDVDKISEIPRYLAMNKEAIRAKAPAPWENDIPGPSSMMYFIINNDSVGYTFAPALEAVKLLIPKFVHDRGDTLADEWAKKMLGNQYQPGMGFGWSPLCEGFLLAGWVGIFLIAFVLAKLAWYIDNLRRNAGGRLRELAIIVTYSCAPMFFLANRESLGALVKQLLLVAVCVWLPTFLLTNKSNGRSMGEKVT